MVEESKIVDAAKGDRKVQVEIARIYAGEEYWSLAWYWAEKEAKQGDLRATVFAAQCEIRMKDASSKKKTKPGELDVPNDLRIRMGAMKSPRPGAQTVANFEMAVMSLMASQPGRAKDWAAPLAESGFLPAKKLLEEIK